MLIIGSVLDTFIIVNTFFTKCTHWPRFAPIGAKMHPLGFCILFINYSQTKRLTLAVSLFRFLYVPRQQTKCAFSVKAFFCGGCTFCYRFNSDQGRIFCSRCRSIYIRTYARIHLRRSFAHSKWLYYCSARCFQFLRVRKRFCNFHSACKRTR